MALPATIGRYEILERLGEGGMGAVYLGRDPNIGRHIAVKVLHGHLRDANLHQRFVQEARSAGALTHPNIVTVHDFGEVDGAPYLVMEYVRGQQVAVVIKRREPVPLATKLEWLEGLCAGLHYAHESKIIHRDIKPQNLMVDERGTLKILDFGIARVAESGLTKMSMVIGTPGYMSPEQIESRSIDRRSDIFSAGAVAYALISYREAFEGDSVASVMHRVITADPPSLSRVCDGLPSAVADVVARALSKSPDDRFQTAGDMQRAIAAARRALPVDAPEPATATLPVPVLPDRRTPASRTPAEFRRRRLEQIERHLRDAEHALARGDAAAATAAAEAALVLDPDHAGAQRLLHLAHEPHTAAFQTEPIAARPDPSPAPTPAPTPPPAPPPTPAPSRAVPPAPPSMRQPRIEPVVAPPAPQALTGRVAAGVLALVVVVGLGVWAMRPAADSRPEPQPPVTREPSPPAPQPTAEPELDRAAAAITRVMTEAASAEEATRWADARARYQEALTLRPDHAEARAGLARMEARLARPAPAPATPGPAARKADGPSAEDRVRANGLVRRATSKYEAGDYDGAIADLNQALVSVPGHEGAATLRQTVLRAKETEAKMPRRPPGR